MNRTFLKVGQQYTDTTNKRDTLALAVATIEWHPLPLGQSLPFSQGYALREMVVEMGVNPDKVGFGQVSLGAKAYSLLAMQNNYTEGEVKRVIVYAIDNGCAAVMVFCDEFTAAEETEAELEKEHWKHQDETTGIPY